jgi:Uma2 family endonuclease
VSDYTWEDFRRQEAGEPPQPIAYTAEDLAGMTPEEIEDLIRHSR